VAELRPSSSGRRQREGSESSEDDHAEGPRTRRAGAIAC
jgi:hypothetical protein